ncbi:MAG: hypothetical protein K2X09_06290 [Rickettsiales bacterium]|nr:hypothetical protein [Rickettsiales bacterium]
MKKFMVVAVSLAALVAMPAQARTYINFGFYAPAPVYYEPAPVVYYPPINHVYYAPRFSYGVTYSNGYGYRGNGYRHQRRYDTAWNGRDYGYGRYDRDDYRYDRRDWHR